MTPAADPIVSTRLTAGWLVLLAVTVVVGIFVPPAGAAIAAGCAVAAHVQRHRRMRTAFTVLAVVFGVLTVLVGALLVSLGGGDTATGG
jgi:hypothetical protein